jgi:hypothetical protein
MRDAVKQILDAGGSVTYNMSTNLLEETIQFAAYRAGFLSMGDDGKTFTITDDGRTVAEGTSDIVTLNRMNMENKLSQNPIKSRKLDDRHMKILKTISEKPYTDKELDAITGTSYAGLELSANFGLCDYDRSKSPLRWILTPFGEEFMKSGSNIVPQEPDEITSIEGGPHTELLSGEHAIIEYYKTTGYAVLARSILEMDIGSLNSDRISHMDNLLKRCKIKEPYTSYNGASTNVGELLLSGKYKRGDLFRLDLFTSTSLSAATAQGFTTDSIQFRHKGANVRVLLKINNPAMSSGYYYGRSDREGEVILPRGTQLKIKSVSNYNAFSDDVPDELVDELSLDSDKWLFIVECDRL